MTNALSAAQCRAARALVDWSRDQLADVSGVSVRTIADLETGNAAPRDSTAHRLVVALEAAGVVLLKDNGDGDGVRLRKTKPEPQPVVIEVRRSRS